jgi:LacI family transcriptional regulator
LFNASKIYDRGIITGIGSYLSSTRVWWNLFLEDDFQYRLNGIEDWNGDGIIADFDDPRIYEVLSRTKIPVVAVGGSYESAADYPRGIPYVATDNFKLVQAAYTHLIEMGLRSFALYSLPPAPENRWAVERENAFSKLLAQDGLEPLIFRGQSTHASTWNIAVEELTHWLMALPKPIGIVAVTDSRARHLLEACLAAGLSVPEEVALIGIDNDPLTRTLARIPLSSVAQGTETMGHMAAQFLHQMLNGLRIPDRRVLVPPAGISVQASSRHEKPSNPYVMRARHFIRQYACQGIKTEQVANYVGISKSSLEQYFRNERGYSVHTEILNFKLDAAKTMLEQNESYNCADIAVRCGFTSVQYMYTVFKRELGCTPREYRDGGHRREHPIAPTFSAAKTIAAA